MLIGVISDTHGLFGPEAVIDLSVEEETSFRSVVPAVQAQSFGY